MTFDCYGTLIDWEAGLLAGLRDVVGDGPPNDDLLEAYARAEADVEAGEWQPYRGVLATALRAVAGEFGASASPHQQDRFGASVADWPPFADSAPSLERLRRQFDLAVITNCDDDLFAATNRRLGEPFRWVVTSQQLHSYKPDPRNFEIALETIGVAPGSVLHVAQSLFHDHGPARALGLRTAWIDRRHGRSSAGATPPATAIPSLSARDMATFADLALAR